MNDDLKALLISDPEFYSAGGMDDVVVALCKFNDSRYRYVGIRLKFLATLAAIALAWGGIYHLRFISTNLPFAFVWLGAAAVLFAFSWIDLRRRFIRKKYGDDTYARYLQFNRSPTFKRLYEETEKFNHLLRAIEQADELAALNVDSAAIAKREKVLQSLAQTRANLIRAIKLDKIRREFADVPASALQNLSLEVSSVESTKEVAKLEQDATAYGQTMNDAIALGMSVQDEIKNLQMQDREQLK